MLKEIRYNVLIVSSNEKVNNAITKYLSVCNCDVKDIANSIPLAKRLLFEREYDIVVISAPVLDDAGLDFAISLSDNERLGVMYLVKAERYDEAYDKTHKFGIITLSKPTPAKLFEQSLKVITSAKTKLSSIKESSSNTLTLKQRMEEIKLFSEAKVLLMKHNNMNEEEAHRYLEKKAMDLRITKRKVAEDLIALYKK